MSKQWIIVFVLVLFLGGLLWFFSSKFSFIKSNEEVINLSVSAEYNNKRIKTGYVIETNEGNIYGNTSESFELVKAPKNQILRVSNDNLDGQYFFKDVKLVNSSNDNQRVSLLLERPKPIKVTVSGGNPKTIILSSEDARSLLFCIKYTKSYIFVDIKDHGLVDKPNYFYTWDKCYRSNQRLVTNNDLKLNLSYQVFTPPQNDDYIKFVVYQEGFFNITQKEVKIL